MILKGKAIAFNINENGCWICISHKKRSKGYVKFFHNGKQLRMHRFVYEAAYGSIPVGKLILHSCDNPECINPGHLRLGTHVENIQDKISRNRQAKGEKSGSSKLTEEQVKEILSSSQSARQLAKNFGVTHRAILKIRHAISWSHLQKASDENQSGTRIGTR